MPSKTIQRSAGRASKTARLETEVQGVFASLKQLANKRIRDEMGSRYGIRGPSAEQAFGVRMAMMQKLAKQLTKGGKNHELALALWEAGDGPGGYEARTVAALIDDPQRVTAAQMDRWCRDFDNWGICDTVCFKLFDQVSPELAFKKVKQWSGKRDEFIKRAAFALLGCLALHNEQADDDSFLGCLPLVERAATDERNFVKKGVSWGLRGVGRRNAKLRAAALALAKRLADSPEPAARWVGRDALRDLTR